MDELNLTEEEKSKFTSQLLWQKFLSALDLVRRVNKLTPNSFFL